jgi:hypothetical protein
VCGRTWRRSALGLLIAGSASPASERPGDIRAARTRQPIHLDGRLNEPAWADAPVFSDFVQSFPDEDAAPTERTELRVLYDDDNIYVGVKCFDSHPNEILRNLGRRDSPPASDSVGIGIDSAHDHRTAYVFQVNASGVLSDGLFFDGTNYTADWDAVWDARVQSLPDGWSAEFVIPLHILRFTEAPKMTWGFAVRREVAHKHETDDSVLLPRSSNQFVQRFGHLTGLVDLKPRRDVELTPYISARANVRPQYSPPDQYHAYSHPRLIDPMADLGLDVKAQLASNLNLNATINPDFGQVEADQILLNLTTYEPFFPEKRPFFLEGMDLFQPVGATNTQQLFYSRRIGLNQPIIGAAKMTGSIVPGLEVGLLDAVVGGAYQSAFAGVTDPGQIYSMESTPNRSLFGLRWNQPLTFGPVDALPETSPVPENYFVGVVRKQFFNNSTVGAIVTAATPLTSACSQDTTEGNTVNYPTAGCLAKGGNAAAVDWNLRSKTADWQFYGQIDASQEVGGPHSTTLYDGTVLSPGDTGVGTYFTAGKLGGEPFRFDVTYEYESPKLDLNALGYLRTQNYQGVALNPRLFETEAGPLHNFGLRLHVNPHWSTDGRWIYRGGNYSLNSDAILPGYHYFGCELGRDEPGFEIREIQYTGVPLEKRATYYFNCWGQTDRNRALSLNAWATAGFHPRGGPTPAQWGYGSGGTLVWRPQARLETQLIFYVDSSPLASHWVESSPNNPNAFLFGDVDAHTLSWTLRQLLVITPRLTLQVYAQLFAAYGSYGPFYSAASNGAPIHFSDLTPVDPLAFDPTLVPSAWPSFHTSALNVNVVLRWEYRLGSTLFLVYSRSQSEMPYALNQPAPANVWPDALLPGPATDTFLIKWAYWWSR